MGIRMNRSTTPKKQVEQGGANTPLHHCSTTPPPKGGGGGSGALGGLPEVVEQIGGFKPLKHSQIGHAI